MDLESVASELYGLEPREFTVARNLRAKDARQAGDRELATAIARLRRPTTSAFLVNALVRARVAQVEDLLALGEALRAAQASLAGDALRQLSRQRRQVVSALGREARQLGRSAGIPVSDSVQREVEATLDAALADPAAADAVRSGRLTGALSYSGLGPVDVSGAVAAPAGRPRLRAVTDGDTPSAEVAAAERAVQQARAELDEARRSAESEQRRVEPAASTLREVRRRVRALKTELEQARGDEATAVEQARSAKRAADSAGKQASSAQRRLDEASAQLQRLQVRSPRRRRPPRA